MKKFILFLFIMGFLAFIPPVSAIYDPLSKLNNKIGIHILVPSEVKDAAEFVNSSGGDWGYVTIPIQSSDKNLEKWQKFMNDCKELHLIPIVRLATNGDYFNTKVWEKPNLATVLDFSNFLNSLDWPTKNKYIVVFNEVNRGDEWGGSPSPKEYADILSYAVTVFKSKSSDFFVISSGMDNASIDNYPEAINQFTYFFEMEKAVPGIFNQIDGIASHSYPNPGFSQLPSILTSKSISSFSFEKNYISNLTSKNLPVFITETGWTRERFTDSQIGQFYKYALDSVWKDENVVAITPFLLNAGVEPFAKFSMKNSDGSSNEIFDAITETKKTKGDPILEEAKKVLGERQPKDEDLPIKYFRMTNQKPFVNNKNNVTIFLKWLLKID